MADTGDKRQIDDEDYTGDKDFVDYKHKEPAKENHLEWAEYWYDYFRDDMDYDREIGIAALLAIAKELKVTRVYTGELLNRYGAYHPPPDKKR